MQTGWQMQVGGDLMASSPTSSYQAEGSLQYLLPIEIPGIKNAESRKGRLRKTSSPGLWMLSTLIVEWAPSISLLFEVQFQI